MITGAGLSSLIDQLAFTLFNPQEAVLLLLPYYAGFNRDFGKRSGVQLIGVNPPTGSGNGYGWEGPDGLGDCFEKAMRRAESEGVKVKGILLCNPHNPTGTVVPRSIILGYCRFAQAHDLHLISDEIYAMSVFDPSTNFTSVLNLGVEREIGEGFDKSRLHVLYGMSKDFGANGFRIGVLINQHDPNLFRLMTGMTLFVKVSSPADIIFSSLLSSDYLRTFLSLSRERLKRAYELVRDWFDARGCEVWPASAGPFVWVFMGHRLGIETWEKEKSAHERLFEEGGVYLSLGKTYHSDRPGYFRLTFAVPEPALLEGLRRIELNLGLDVQ